MRARGPLGGGPTRAQEPSQPERAVAGPARSIFAMLAVALLALAGIYAGVSFLGDRIPEFAEDAFELDIVRWVLVGIAVFAGAAMLFVDRNRRRAAEALLAELRRGEDLARRGEDLAALTEASRGLNRAQPEVIMEAVARGAAVTVGAVDAVVYALDEDRRVMVPIGWTPNAKTQERSLDDAVGRSALSRQPVLSNDPPPSTVVAPVVVGDDLAGVVMAYASGKRFGDRELRVLASYATDASVAIARARALQQERSVAERLIQIDRDKSDFVAAVTHELKTPLTSLLGYASILRKRVDALPKERRDQFFEIIQRQGERILRLIGELLESSRMESGLAKLRREPIDLHRLVEAVVAGMKPAAKRHTIEVALPETDPGLWGDPSALEHILTNLLDNALKYSPKRTTVRIWTEVSPNELRINVSNEGAGIPPEELPFIFERFRRGDDQEVKRNGVGLGLFIVRSLVEAQGGSVSCTSAPGSGSTFTVTFPRRADRSEEPLQMEEPAASSDPLTITLGSAGRPVAANGSESPDEASVSVPAESIDAQTLRAVAESHKRER